MRNVYEAPEAEIVSFAAIEQLAVINDSDDLMTANQTGGASAPNGTPDVGDRGTY